MKILVVKYPLLAPDIAQEWAKRGHEVSVIHPNDLTLDSLRELKRRRFDFVFGINYAPVLSSVCRDVGLPYVSWTIDPLEESRWPTELSDHEVLFCFRKRWVERWREVTGAPITYLPLAATSNRRGPREQLSESVRTKLLWVGNSCAGDWQRHPKQLREWFAEHQGTIEDWVTRRVSQLDQLGGLQDGAVALGALKELSNTAPSRWQVLVDDLTAFRGRVELLKRLETERLEMWGDPYWKRFGALYRGFAEHEHALTELYSRAALTLDIPRWYQTDIVTMRVFDSMASGGVILTYDNDDIREMFCAGLHLETYSSPEEFESKTVELLHDENRRAVLRRSGKACVDRFHRIHHRLDVIETELRERGWWRAPDIGVYSSAGLASAASGAT